MLFHLTLSHLNGRKWRKGEELGHPQLKVEAKAVEDGPDVDQLAGAEPQRRDGKGAHGGQELLEDPVVISTDVVVDIPASGPHTLSMTRLELPTLAKTSDFLHSLAQPVIDASVKVPAKGDSEL